MINNVLNEIVEAEAKAKAMKENADEDAKIISLSAIAESEKLKEELTLETKSLIKAKLDAAKEDADREVTIIDKEAKDAAESAMKYGERNSLKAIETITDIIIKNI